MPAPLPPMNTLRLFEAAGRHSSFKLAAAELAVTPGAVSHAIQALEDWLGTQLFTRGSRGLSLTAAGAAYLQPVHEALALLASGSEQVPGQRAKETLVISVPPTIAARFLLPRLARFRKIAPETSLIVDTSAAHVQFPRDAVDLAIRLGYGEWPPLQVEHLMDEYLIPVSSPAIKEAWHSVADLNELPLIHATSTSQDWGAWAEGAGMGAVDTERGLKVDTIQMAFEAAMNGLGIAIGRRPLVDPDLASGALVSFFPTTVKSKFAYWFVGPKETMDRDEIRAFRNWLHGEVSDFEQSAGQTLPEDTDVANLDAIVGSDESLSDEL